MAGKSRVKIVVTGGGTGGHTYPALTTLRAIQRQVDTAEITWVGTAAGLEARIAAESGIPFKALVTGKLRRTKSLKSVVRNLGDAFRIPVGLLQAFWLMLRIRPDVAFSTGGYVAVPIGVAAWLTRRPLVMHEQTRTLGLANRILSRFATVIAVSSESSLDALSPAARARTVVTGNPIRPELLAGDGERALKHFGLRAGLPLVYVTGGALGARQINDLVAEILPKLLDGCQVLHQCGSTSIEKMRAVAAALPDGLRERYRVEAFVGDELPDVFAAADIVISRAGAGTLAELTALGKVMVPIPLVPTGGDEQRRSALHLGELGAARPLAGKDATPQRLLAELRSLLADADLRERIAKAAREQGRPDAADTLADAILRTAGRPNS